MATSGTGHLLILSGSLGLQLQVICDECDFEQDIPNNPDGSAYPPVQGVIDAKAHHDKQVKETNMPRARKPFKSFNANSYVFAVKVETDNIEDIAKRLNGLVEENYVHPDTDRSIVQSLRLPGLYEPLIVQLGEYVYVNEDNYLDSCSEEEFEEKWVVPNGLLQSRAKEEHDAADE